MILSIPKLPQGFICDFLKEFEYEFFFIIFSMIDMTVIDLLMI